MNLTLLKWLKRLSIGLLAALSLMLLIAFLPISVDEKAPSLHHSGEISLGADAGEKIAPEVKREVARAVFEKKDKITVIVKSTTDVASEIRKSKGKIRDEAGIDDLKFVEVEISPEKIADLAEEKKVEKIYPVVEYSPMLAESVPLINADIFWNAGYKGNGIKVAVVDTGIDKNHPMLTGKVIAERDFSGSGSANDINSHGTHVAGIIAGTTANGGTYSGVAPEAQLLNAKVIADSTGFGSNLWIISAIDWAVSSGADVISMSLGAPTSLDGALNDAIKSAVDSGVVVVVSSGNCGEGCPSAKCGSYRGVTSPGSSPYAISVGAVDKSKQVACFSSGGSIPGVGIKPDVTAPGVNIMSSVPGGAYASKMGTSMAAPHVSGAVALLLSENHQLTQDDVVRIFEKTSLDLGELGKDTAYGSGLIDLEKALSYKEGIEPTVNFEKQLTSGESQKIDVIISDDVLINNVTGAVTNPDGAKADVAFSNSGGGVYTHEYANTTLLGTYIIDIAINYGSTSESSDVNTTNNLKQKTATSYYRTSFNVISLLGEFVNIESISIPQQQLLSKHLAGNITFSNAAATELNVSVLLQLFKNVSEDAEQEIRLPLAAAAAGSASNIPINNALEVLSGNYTLKIFTDYGAGSLINETNITVIDDLAPEIQSITAKESVAKNNPIVFIIKVNERSSLSEITLSLESVYPPCPPEDMCPALYSSAVNADYTTKITSDAGDEKELAVTILDDLGTSFDHYEATIKVCDASDNCADSEAMTFNVTACEGKQLLAVKSYEKTSAFEEAAGSGVCLSVLNKGLSGTPPASYLENFDAVVWTAGTDTTNIEDRDAAVLADYYEKKGKLVVEGSDVAFKHRTDDFMHAVLHSELKNDLDFSAASAEEARNISINITRQHPVLKGLQNPPSFNATIDAFPDLIKAYNGSAELAEWVGLETNGSAMVIYEDGQKKTLFLPFSIDALAAANKEIITANIVKWLMENSSVDVWPLGIKYSRELPGASANDYQVCAAVCIPLWEIKNNACVFNSCGSGCGPDGITRFGTKNECELELYGIAKIPIAGQPSEFITTIKSTEELQSAPVINISIDGEHTNNNLLGTQSTEYSYVSTATLDAGIHKVSVLANSDFSIAENNYINNFAEYNLTVYPSEPDLAVSSMSYSYNRDLAAIMLGINVSNMGGTAVSSSIKIYLDDAEKAEQGFDVSAGETKQLNFQLESGRGIYELIVDIDPHNAVAEYNESNNEFQETLYLCSREKIIVVDDNDAEFYSTEHPSSAGVFAEILRNAEYCVEEWDEKQQGALSPEHANTFQLIIWSAGDYFGNITTGEDRALIANYGKGVLVEGSDIAMELSEDNLLETLTGNFFSQDLMINKTKLVLQSHAISTGISTLEIDNEKSPYPDSVEAISGQVVASWPDGSAAITANQGANRKTAYYGFSVDGVTDDAVRDLLVLNTIEWLLEAPNNPPVAEFQNMSTSEVTITMNEGQTRNFSIIASDPDNDPLTFMWLLNSTIVSTTENFTFSPKYNESGHYNLTAVVSDGEADASIGLLIIVLDTLDCEAGQTQLCAMQLGVCSNSFEGCFEGQWLGCTAENYSAHNASYEAEESTCDSLDNNCDGNVDENRVCNTAPVLGHVGSKSVHENSTLNFTLNVFDSEGDELFMNATGLPSGAEFSNVTFSWTPNFEQAGNYSVMFNASDGLLSDYEEINITVINTNRAPVISSVSPGTNGSVDENSSLEFTAAASDPDGDAVAYNWVMNNEKVSDTDTFVFSPGFEDAGIHLLSVIASDGNLSDIEEITITVNNVNRAPVLEHIGNQTVKENSTLIVVPAASDPDGDEVSFSFTAPLNESGAWHTSFNDAGQYTTAITAGDGSLNDSEEINITVLNVNRPPVILMVLVEPIGLVMNEGENKTFITNAADPDEDSVTVMWKIDGETVSEEPDYEFSPDFDAAGQHEVAVTVSDGTLTKTQEFTITVNNVNRAPIWGELPAMLSIQEDTPFTHEISAVDPDKEDTVSYSVNDSAFTISNESMLTWTPPENYNGAKEVVLTATDSLLSTDKEISITVTPVNDAPVIDAAYPESSTAKEGTRQVFSINASDVDNDELSISWYNDGKEVSQSDSYAMPIDYNSSGSHNITVLVNDSEFTLRKEWLMGVQDINRPPIITNMLPYGAMKEGEYRNFTASVYDPDRDELAYEWHLDNEFVSGESFLEYFAGEGAAGIHNITLIVSDGKTETARTHMQQVIKERKAPKITGVEPGTSVMLNEGENMTFSVSVDDPEGVSYRWVLDGRTVGAKSEYTYTAGFDSSGTHTLAAFAQRSSMKDAAGIEINVINVNREPQITYAPSGIAMQEGEKRNLTIRAYDPDYRAAQLYYKWHTDNKFVSEEETFEYSPDYDSAGTHEFLVEISDRQSITTHSFTATVLNTNRAPIIEPINNITANTEEPITITAIASDPDNENSDPNDDNELTYSISDQRFVQDKNVFVLPAQHTASAFTASIWVSDGQRTATQKVNITIS